MKEKIKKIPILALAGMISLGMMIGSFNLEKAHAMTPVDEAKIEVGKTLTINGTKFPNIQNFEFELEAIEGYTNPNPSTTIDGQKINASAVPMPTGAANNKITKAVGDFRTAATGDTATTRTRKDAFGNIKYTTAGYYLYKMTEKIPSTKVPSVVYDESSYYVVVYVVNNIDEEGNTIDGVHVESITAWHNAKGSDANKPNLKDIANYGKTNGDDNTGDNNGQAAKSNSTYGQNPDNEQRWDDLGKVGKSTPPDPDDPNNTEGDDRNKLDTYKFWNKQEMHDIKLVKNVKGNLGDVTKQFEFTVTLTGLESGETYVVEKTGPMKAATQEDVDAGSATEVGQQIPKSLPILVSAEPGSINNSANTVTVNEAGNATFIVKMTDAQAINLKNIPNSAKYKVQEAASNHVPDYEITSSNTAPETVYTAVSGAAAKEAPSVTYYTNSDGSTVVEDVTTLDDEDTVYKKETNPNAAKIVKKTDNTNNEKETALQTAEETVDSTDGNITITYTNTRDLETITGIPNMAIYFGVAGLIAVLALLAIRKRKDNGIVEL